MKYLLIGCTLALFLTQLFFWERVGFLDEGVWLERLALHEENLAGRPLGVSNFLHSNAPNVSVLTLAVIAQQFGAAQKFALMIAVSMLTALSAALGTLLVYLLEPRKKWWLAVAFVLAAQGFLVSTPASAPASTLVPVIVIAALYAYHKRTICGFVTVGVVVAVGFLTRWPASTIVSVPLSLLLIATMGKRVVTPLAAGFMVTAILLAPVVLTNPVGFFEVTFVKSLLNFDTTVVNTSLDTLALLRQSLVALISMGLAIVYVVRQRDWRESLFPLTLLAASALYAVAFTAIAAPWVRHWYPLTVSWVVLLPYWVLQLTARRAVHAAVVALLIAGSVTTIVLALT